MLAATGDREIDLKKLYWVGPTTVAAAVIVVRLLQVVAVAILHPPERSLLRSEEPAAFTAVLVAIAVVVFAIVAKEASQALRTYNRIAFLALVLLVSARCGARLWVDPWRRVVCSGGVHPDAHRRLGSHRLDAHAPDGIQGIDAVCKLGARTV
jgi:hypothetical protein